MRALEGMRVVEMGLWVAGPAVGGLLADWGADVIKVEAKSGDPMRGLFGTLSGSKEPTCPPFDQHNRGKRSVALDVNTDEGADIVRRLVADADVFITNMRSSFLERVGLDHQALLAGDPRLIYASLTGYGLEGPDANAPGFDVAAFAARAGVADRCTTPGQPPTNMAAGMGDTVTAMSMTAGILAAVIQRERTGEGQLVHTSLLRSGIYTIGMDISTRLALDRIGRAGDRTRPQNPMLNSYPTGDERWIWLMGAEAERHWPGLVAALETPELDSDERFQTARDRRRNGTELVAWLDEIFRTRSRAEWAKAFAEHDVWWAPVNTPEDLLEDPQVEAAGTFVPAPPVQGAEDNGPVRAVATPIDFGAAETGFDRPPPRVGGDTDDILGAIGMDIDEIQRLRESGVLTKAVAASPPVGVRSANSRPSKD